MEQRISLKFPSNAPGAARKQTRRLVMSASAEEAVLGGPNSARNTVNHLEQAKSRKLRGEVFGIASSLVKQ